MADAGGVVATRSGIVALVLVLGLVVGDPARLGLLNHVFLTLCVGACNTGCVDSDFGGLVDAVLSLENFLGGDELDGGGRGGDASFVLFYVDLVLPSMSVGGEVLVLHVSTTVRAKVRLGLNAMRLEQMLEQEIFLLVVEVLIEERLVRLVLGLRGGCGGLAILAVHSLTLRLGSGALVLPVLVHLG